MNTSKREAKALLGLTTDADLARLLGISRQALHAIDDDEPLPDGRQWQLRALRPDLFPLPDGQGTNAA
jgi:DNA-binding XRE family transcriptional regulator